MAEGPPALASLPDNMEGLRNDGSVFPLILSMSQLQDALQRLHSTVHISRINMMPSDHAIVFQGTSEQLARAKELLNE